MGGVGEAGRARPAALSRGGSETELSAAIREAINLQPGARLRRNNLGRLKDAIGRWVAFGQGTGSPDLMGAVTIDWWVELPIEEGGPLVRHRIARAFHLEVKLPGKEPDQNQLAWHAEARVRGEFVAVVRSVDEALAALARCRRGECE